MKHKSSKIQNLYLIEEGKIKRQRNCPRCGTGIFLAKHANRWACGKCHYTEILKS